MVLNGVFYYDGSTASGSSCRVVCVVDCIVGKFEIAFLGKVGLRKEHDIYVADGKKRLQLVSMMCGTVGIPQGEL
jgi:hypothetical protein